MSQFSDMSKVCDNKDCDNESYFIPQLQFFAKGFVNRNAPPMEMSIGFAVCKKCAETMTAKEMITPEMKKLVGDICKRAGLVSPNYKKTEIKFMRILSIPYKLPIEHFEDKKK